MLGQDCELKFEMLKIILSNPANKIREIDEEDVSKQLSAFIQAVWKDEPHRKAEGKP